MNLSSVQPSAFDIVSSLYKSTIDPSSGIYINEDVVPVADWITDPYYCGSIARDLYPFWRDVIIEFEEEQKNELILTGAISTGKSFCALVLMLRKIYVLSCYYPLPSYLGLADNSLILFVYLALSIKQANLTGFGKLLRMIDSTPYFRDIYPRDRDINSECRFESKDLIVISGSDIDHYRGGDLFGLIFDEGNFRKGTDKTKLDKAWSIYTESTNRRRTRFLSGSVDRSFSVIVSSTDEASSFTEERIRQGAGDDSVMIVRATTWQTKPDRYSGKKFWVYKGSEKIEPFLASDASLLKSYFNVLQIDPVDISELPVGRRSNWVEIPEEFRTLFESNLVRALADVAGVAVGGSGRILSDERALDFCFSQESDLKHPFTRDRIVMSYKTDVRIEDYLIPFFTFRPGIEYYAHIDQSLTNDSTGMAIAHKEVDDGGTLIVVDLMLKIDPPPKPDQISIRKVREFLLYLRDNNGLNLKFLSYDQYASAEAIQEMNLAGITTDRLSVDRDSSQYDFLVDMILRRRIRSYFYKPFREEVLFLEKDKIKRKVDHLPGRQKDLSDAVAGAVWNAQIHGSAGTDWLALVNS